MNHRPRKRFGQHFLTDEHVVAAIAGHVAGRGQPTVIEIGPGTGALTAGLIARGLAVRAVELDRDLVPRLRERFPAAGVEIFEADVLSVDFTRLGAPEPLVVCGNLPYNVSSPILFRLATLKDALDSMTFMLQKEVVDRMLAAPGSKAYGRLSVMLQLDFTGERVLDVPPAAFTPPPRVDSGVVALYPRPLPSRVACRETLGRVVSAAFGRRRKTLRNALAGLTDPAGLEAVGIDPGARAETVPVEAFVALANRISEAGTGADHGPR